MVSLEVQVREELTNWIKYISAMQIGIHLLHAVHDSQCKVDIVDYAALFAVLH